MSGLGRVPYLDVAATFDPSGNTATLFILNRDLVKPRELELDWQGLTPSRVTSSQVISGTDLKAANTFDAPKRVTPQALEPPSAGRSMILQLPPRSYSMVTVAV